MSERLEDKILSSRALHKSTYHVHVPAISQAGQLQVVIARGLPPVTAVHGGHEHQRYDE